MLLPALRISVQVAVAATVGVAAAGTLAGWLCARRRFAGRELLVETPAPFRVLVTPASVRELRLEPGRKVFLLVKAHAFHRLV